MKLNIYEKQKVIKTYEATAYNVPFGVVEDVAGLIDMDKLNIEDELELLKTIGGIAIRSMDTIKELLHDIFPDITDEDIRKASLSEITIILVDIIKYTFDLLMRNVRGKNQTSR